MNNNELSKELTKKFNELIKTKTYIIGNKKYKLIKSGNKWTKKEA